MKVYIAGPMTGIPQFNVPAFIYAAADLRGKGYDVLSPYEMDVEAGIGDATIGSPDGDLTKLVEKTGSSWGDVLARDVKAISDNGVDGIFVLEGWEKSRGARLEVFVGLLNKLPVFEYPTGLRIPTGEVTRLIRESFKEAE